VTVRRVSLLPSSPPASNNKDVNNRYAQPDKEVRMPETKKTTASRSGHVRPNC
jgi:hypothetical protein